jgi:cytochrome oxidase Cu insertion factor (SCO1/SenC/PrrC family)
MTLKIRIFVTILVLSQSMITGCSPKVGDSAAGLAVGLAVGNLAPDIVGSDLDGNEFKLSDYRGKVVMLDFWGDW